MTSTPRYSQAARLHVLDSTVDDDGKVLAQLEVTGADGNRGLAYQTQVLLTVRGGLVIDILQVDDDDDDAPPTVELLFFAGCANHAAFLPHLQQLLDSHDVSSPVQLVEVTDDRQAHQLRFLGSPSLRINGVDVEPGADSRSGYGLQRLRPAVPHLPHPARLERHTHRRLDLSALHAEHRLDRVLGPPRSAFIE